MPFMDFAQSKFWEAHYNLGDYQVDHLTERGHHKVSVHQAPGRCQCRWCLPILAARVQQPREFKALESEPFSAAAYI